MIGWKNDLKSSYKEIPNCPQTFQESWGFSSKLMRAKGGKYAGDLKG